MLSSYSLGYDTQSVRKISESENFRKKCQKFGKSGKNLVLSKKVVATVFVKKKQSGVFKKFQPAQEQ